MLTSLEMRFMWFKRLSPLKALFFFNRYLSAAILVCVLCFGSEPCMIDIAATNVFLVGRMPSVRELTIWSLPAR
jgi:hypothetical protein